MTDKAIGERPEHFEDRLDFISIVEKSSIHTRIHFHSHRGLNAEQIPFTATLMAFEVPAPGAPESPALVQPQTEVPVSQSRKRPTFRPARRPAHR